MSLRNKGLVLAMEENDDFGGEDGDVSESMLDVETSASDLNESEEDISEIDASIDDAAADSDTLENIQDTMQKSVDDGEGMNETAAEIAEVAVEAICARLGIVNSHVIPSLESFGSTQSRTVATKIAIEGIGDTVRKVWESIKKAYEAVKKWIVEFYKKWMTALGGIKRAQEDLKAKVKNHTDKKLTQTTIKKESLAEGLAVNNVANIGSVTELLVNHLAVTKTINGIKSLLTGTVKDIQKIDFMKDDEGDTENSQTKLTSTAKTIFDIIKKLTGPLYDGNSLEGIINDSDDGFIKVLLTKKVKSTAASLPVLKKKEMTAILNVTAELIGDCEAMSKGSSDMVKILDAATDTISSIIKLAGAIEGAREGADKAAIKKRVKIAKDGVNGVKKAIISVGVQVPSLNYKLIKGCFTYINASMNAE
jgi:hypothetical protein